MKKFIAVWGLGYEPQYSVCDERVFTRDLGYYPEDIAAIEALEVGQMWRHDGLEIHHVTRLA